ncbi:MAG: hypothetical protein Q7S09_06000 [bacterium]|nr:hypothetical protein [bacterium]
MKNITIALAILIALSIGGAAGYSFGRGANDGSAENKELQDSITMMKEQSATIEKMGEMMKSAGEAMQTMGLKYNDEEAVMKGRDLEAVGAKYMGENEAQEGSGSMKQMMK